MQHQLLLLLFLFLLSEQKESRSEIKTHVVKHRNKGWKIGTIKDRGGEDYQDDGKVIVRCDSGRLTLGAWVRHDIFYCTLEV